MCTLTVAQRFSNMLKPLEDMLEDHDVKCQELLQVQPKKIIKIKK